MHPGTRNGLLNFMEYNFGYFEMEMAENEYYGQQSNASTSSAICSSDNHSSSPVVQRRMVLTLNSAFSGIPSPQGVNMNQSREVPIPSGCTSPHTTNVGGVEADNFIESFLDVPRINNVVSGPAVEQEMTKINQTLSDISTDWTKRVDALKRLRSMVIAGADIYKEFFTSLRFVDIALQMSIKDLRSQVVREACVTLSFLSQQLGQKFERSAELIMPHLISLIPNSAKIISSSGIVAIRFILQNTHSSKLVPIVVNHLQTSRSKEVRRYCCEFFKHMLFVWPRESLEKHASLLQEAIKRGISDADSEARALSRQAYWHFCDIFPEQADLLVNQLDASNRRILEDGRHTSPGFGFQRGAAIRSSSRVEPKFKKPSETEINCQPLPRASSAIDADAVRRARAKSGIPVASKSSGSGLATPLRSRKQIGSQSTCTSRDQSPNCVDSVANRRKIASRSSATSRENSPEKRSFSGLPLRTASAIRGGGAKKPIDNRGYQSDNDGSEFGSQNSLSSARFTYIRFQNVPDIIALLSNPNWSSRKEGLLGLQKYLRSERLYPAEVDNVRLLLTRMMSDPTTKVFSLFLDTLYDFLNVHKLDLGSWLYVLMTRLLGKMSVDLLPTIQLKLDRCFELIRASFAPENQFQQLLKFVNDNLQTPNLKVKGAYLNYLNTLISKNMVPSDFKNTSAVRLGVTKILNWSLEGKTPELKKQAQKVIVSLHELNPGEFTSMLALMDDFLRDTALRIIGGKEREHFGLTGSRQGSSQNLSGPISSKNSSPSVQSSNDENMNPDDFYATLKQTTEAIEKFSMYSNVDYSSGDEGKRNPSEDSGFSRNSLNIPNNIERNQDETKDFRKRIQMICNQICDNEKSIALNGCAQLEKELRESNSTVWTKEDGTIAVQVASRLLFDEDPELVQIGCKLIWLFMQFKVPGNEQTLLTLIELQNNDNRNVSRSAAEILGKVKSMISLPKCIEVLRDQILSEDSPKNMAAAAFVKNCIECCKSTDLENVLPKGFNVSSEPNVRKECMLSIVDIHAKLGAAVVNPFVKDLTTNKIKLLNLYLQRKQ